MEQRNDLGASAEDSGHAFRYNLVAEPTRISASIVGANTDDDDMDEDEWDDGELIGYVCASCGHSQGHQGLGGLCDRCCGPLDEWRD